jgi:hypothetical protein
MGLTYEGQPVEGAVTITEKDGSESEVKQKLKDELLPSAYATVGYKMGHTKNLGNYESLRVEVSINWPCEGNVETIDSTYAKCRVWVEEKEAVIAEVDTL